MPQLVNQYNEPKIWSGGTTTELFIYPEGATYEDRNFKFRLSIATVESETSEFTPLAGVKRTLMLLHGELTLKHEGQYEKHGLSAECFSTPPDLTMRSTWRKVLGNPRETNRTQRTHTHTRRNRHNGNKQACISI